MRHGNVLFAGKRDRVRDAQIIADGQRRDEGTRHLARNDASESERVRNHLALRRLERDVGRHKAAKLLARDGKPQRIKGATKPKSR